jgi:hypothetical protein
MKVWILAIINLACLGSLCAEEAVGYDDGDYNEYYYQETPCCQRHYLMRRRPSDEEERTYKKLTESYWPGKRQDSIIDEVTRY